MPFSKFWHKVNKQEVPLNAVWLSVIIAFCMALTVRHSSLQHLHWTMCITIIHSSSSLISAVTGKLGSISSHGVDCYNWALHCVCPANLFQSDSGSKVLQSRAFQLGAIWCARWLDCSPLGGNDFCSLLVASRVSRHQGNSELHSCCSWRAPHSHSFFMDPKRQALV